jgi:hypothetical protein
MERSRERKTTTSDMAKEDEKFYRKVWAMHQDSEGHCVCEECQMEFERGVITFVPLLSYSAVYVSHWLARGARTDLRHNLINAGILCFIHHRQWEDGTNRKSMLIYPSKAKLIQKLKESNNGD